MINANAGQPMDDKLLYSNVILISNCFRFSILYVISNQHMFIQSVPRRTEIRQMYTKLHFLAY